jgi:hypothetical protein
MCLKLRKIKIVYMVDYMNPRSTYSLKVINRASRDSLGSIYCFIYDVTYMFFICMSCVYNQVGYHTKLRK